jgi:hypothetical protein
VRGADRRVSQRLGNVVSAERPARAAAAPAFHGFEEVPLRIAIEHCVRCTVVISTIGGYMSDEDRRLTVGSFWNVLSSCRDCGSDVLQLVRSNPDEHVRCLSCEATHVLAVSDRLLHLALTDLST